jgi:hypothetical protein
MVLVTVWGCRNYIKATRISREVVLELRTKESRRKEQRPEIVSELSCWSLAPSPTRCAVASPGSDFSYRKYTQYYCCSYSLILRLLNDAAKLSMLCSVKWDGNIITYDSIVA